MITLFYTPEACSMASHITLEETGVDYESRMIDMDKSEQKSPEYLKINPRGKVPALIVDDTIILENVAIQYYIAKRFPAAGLAPTDPMDEAQWMSTITWISNTVHPTSTHLSRTYLFTESEETYPAIRATATENLWKYLSEIDARLADREWLLGPQYTTADPYALVFYGASKRKNMPMTELKHFTKWKHRMLERPAVRKVLEREQSILLARD